MHWPVVGRARELGLIRLLRQGPECHGVVLVGSAGVGKTRLAREVLRLTEAPTEADGWLAAAGSTQGIPFGVLAHLLPVDPGGPSDRLELLRSGREALAELAERAAGVLVVDDAHLLDELSATVVQQLASDGSVFAVLTLRLGEQLPGPLVGLCDSGLVERVEIGPLDRAAVDELVAGALGGQVEGRTLHELWRLSCGNPLFLRELVGGARESGLLTERTGMWRHEGSFAGFVRIREVIEARLGHLTDEQREALEALALAEPLGMHLLERISSGEGVEQLEQRGLVEVWQDGRRLLARTVHPLYAEVVAEAMPELRARRIRRRLADLFQELGCRRREDLLRLASLRLASGSPSDPSILVRAGRQAQVVFDHVLAERLALAARDQGGGFDAALLLAEAAGGQGRLDEAERLAIELAEAAASDVERTRAVLARANLLVFQRGDPQVLDLLDRAAATVSAPSCRDELDGMLVFAASYLGELPRAIESGQAFLARDDPAPGALLRVLVVYTYARALMADYRGLDEEIERGLELARRHPDVFPLAEHLLQANRGFALRGSGQLAEAERLARDRYEQAIIDDVRDVQGLWATQVAHALDVRGHAAESVRYYDEAIALLVERDPVGMRLLVLALATYPAGLLGDRDRAAQWLSDYDHHAQVRVPAFGTVWEARARAWVYYLDGDLPGAGEQASHAGAIGVKEHLLFFAALAFHDAVRFGYPELVVDDLAELRTKTQGELIALLTAHAQAVADGDTTHLETLVDRFENIGAELYAAETAGQAAYFHKQARQMRSYRRCRARAVRLAGRCAGVSTPWLWTHRPDDLTLREFEVAAMAARGLTNREISDRLDISPRTVGNHLASVYAKLGAAGRDELAALLDFEHA